MFFKPKKKPIAPAYRMLPQYITGPVVDFEGSVNMVADAGLGLLEQGVDSAVRQLRTLPPQIVILDIE